MTIAVLSAVRKWFKREQSIRPPYIIAEAAGTTNM